MARLCHGRRVDETHPRAIAQLAAAGFDLVHAFDARTAAREPGWEWIAAYGAGLLVGNTRALWPVFEAALPDLAQEPHPLDRYTERAVEAAFAGATIVHAHLRRDGAYLPFQRLAEAVGLAVRSPTQLLIHPTYGPWFAVRSLVLVDGVAPVRAPIARACACTGACEQAFATAQTSTSLAEWLAVRDACGMSAWRYSEAQIAYHYTRAWPGTAPR